MWNTTIQDSINFANSFSLLLHIIITVILIRELNKIRVWNQIEATPQSNTYYSNPLQKKQ